MDKVNDVIKDNVLSTVLHGCVCHSSSNPHNSGNKMKRNKKKLYEKGVRQQSS